MKKDLIFAPIMLAVGATLFLLRLTGIPVHIIVAVVGMFVLAMYTATTQKGWKIPVLEVIMRVCYGIALVTGPIVMKLEDVAALNIIHKVGATLFVVLLIVLFVHKLIANKNVKN